MVLREKKIVRTIFIEIQVEILETTWTHGNRIGRKLVQYDD